jgi:sulfite exporter TauE/SafE
MMSIEWTISAFILGLGGSLHCLGMCGPLVLMVPFKSQTRSGSIANMAFYFISKALMYGVLGMLIGMFGVGVKWLTGQYILSFVAGCFMLGIVLWPVLNHWLAWPSAMHQKISKWFYRLSSTPKWYYFIGLGMLNALLPCMMILAAAGASIALADPVKGFVFMLIFGLGTAPALIVASLSRTAFRPDFRLGMQWTSKLIAILLGVVLILRGLNLELPHSHHPVINQVSKIITCKVPE